MSRSDIGESYLSVSPAGDIKDAARGISNENKKVEKSFGKKRNNKKKIFTRVVITAIPLTILAVIITAAVKLRGKTGADNQSGNNSTNPIENYPEQTGNKKQQGTEQTGSDDTQVVSNKNSSSVLPNVLKVGGTIAGSMVPPAAIVTAVRLNKKFPGSKYLYLNKVKKDDFVVKGSNTTTNKSEPKKVVGKPFSAKKLDAAKDKKTEVVK